jgi:hypothetical protein
MMTPKQADAIWSQLHDGDTIWTLLVVYPYMDGPKAVVKAATVFSAEHRLLRWDDGRVAPTGFCDVIYLEQAVAWEKAAEEIRVEREKFDAELTRCVTAASASRVGEAVPQ